MKQALDLMQSLLRNQLIDQVHEEADALNEFEPELQEYRKAQ